jgi:hypothetical protein
MLTVGSVLGESFVPPVPYFYVREAIGNEGLSIYNKAWMNKET